MQLTEPDRMLLEAKFGVTSYGLFNRFVANAVLEAETRFNRKMALYEAGKIKDPPVMESEKEAFEAKMVHLRQRADHNPDEITQAETVEPDFEPKPDEPPAGIADLFQADKPLAPQARALRELWLQIGHQIQRGEAKADEIRKHERLSSELEFINRHAFDGV